MTSFSFFFVFLFLFFCILKKLKKTQTPPYYHHHQPSPHQIWPTLAATTLEVAGHSNRHYLISTMPNIEANLYTIH